MPCESKTTSFKICRCACKWRCQCLIPRERKPRPPFNSSLRRGSAVGLHPKYYTTNLETPGVGTYDPLPIKPKSAPVSWDCELESREFSKTVGDRISAEEKFNRELTRTVLGPGVHEISQWPENVMHKACKTIKNDIGFGTVPLFEPKYSSTTPGPGYTRKSPFHYKDRNRFRSFSSVPSFEYDGLQRRFRESMKPWSLPCNRYNVKHPDTLEAVLNKVTGKRGPYDLFTGPRDETTVKGYMTMEKREDRGDWPRALPGEIGKLLRKSNYFKGRWTTCPRFPKISGIRLMLTDVALCYKNPKDPGPANYDPRSPRKPLNVKEYPFDSCVAHVRPVPKSEVRPGPGRYKIRDRFRIPGHGWTWVFKSKAPRTKFIMLQSYNNF